MVVRKEKCFHLCLGRESSFFLLSPLVKIGKFLSHFSPFVTFFIKLPSLPFCIREILSPLFSSLIHITLLVFLQASLTSPFLSFCKPHSHHPSCLFSSLIHIALLVFWREVKSCIPLQTTNHHFSTKLQDITISHSSFFYQQTAKYTSNSIYLYLVLCNSCLMSRALSFSSFK